MNKPDQDGSDSDLFDKVRVNVVSWMIIAGIGGIAYLAYTVPRQIDSVLLNQAHLGGKQAEVIQEIVNIKKDVEKLKEAHNRSRSNSVIE